MSGDDIQNANKKAFLRNDYYQMNEWDNTQLNGQARVTAYRMKGHIVGMSAIQIICFSIYLILTAPKNIGVLI